MILRTLAATCLVASFSSAQDLERFLPAKPVVRLEFDGPSTLAERFDGTNVAAMMQSAEFADLRGRLMTEFKAVLDEEAPPGARELVDALGEALDGYGGRVAVGIGLESVDGEPAGMVSFALAPHGDTDLESVASLLNEKFAEEDLPIGEKTMFDGSSVEVLEDEEQDMSMVLPKVIDGHLFMAIGTVGVIDEFVPQLGDPDRQREPSKNGVHIELTKELFQLLPTIAEEGGNAPPEMLDFLGEMFGGLGVMNIDMHPRGKFVDTKVVMDYDADAPGFVSVIEPANKERNPLVALASRTKPNFNAMSINVEGMIDVLGSLGVANGSSFEELEREFEQNMGLQLRADVLDHLTGDFMIVDNSAETDVDSGDLSMVLAVGLSDAAALEASVEKLLRDNGLHAARKTNEYRGIQVRQMNLFFPVNWAFTDTALLFSFGERTDESIRSMIDAADDRKNGKEPAEWPENVARRMAHAGQNWQWMQISDASGEADRTIEAFEYDLDELEVSDEVYSVMEDLIRLMDRFDLMTMVAATSFEKGRLVMHQVW